MHHHRARPLWGWAGRRARCVGLTIVAIATTLPEIVTCVIASRKGHADLAVGTVVGSNLFNIILVMGITSLVQPVAMPTDGWLVLGIMWRISRKLEGKSHPVRVLRTFIPPSVASRGFGVFS